jgi:hypothetical protein
VPAVSVEEHPPSVAATSPSVLNETMIETLRSITSLLQSRGSVRVN